MDDRSKWVAIVGGASVVMGCGSPLGDLFYLADALLDSHHFPGYPAPAHWERQAGDEGLSARLYKLYGNGVIGAEVFSALRALADRDARLGGLDARMAGKPSTARQAVGRDEDTAGRRLAEKAELAASRDRLADQARAVRARGDLCRVPDALCPLSVCYNRGAARRLPASWLRAHSGRMFRMIRGTEHAAGRSTFHHFCAGR